MFIETFHCTCVCVFSGSSVMRDGSTINSNYRLDLDNLRIGSCVGVMRCSDLTLHYYLDGVDQGVACTDVPSGLQSTSKFRTRENWNFVALLLHESFQVFG